MNPTDLLHFLLEAADQIRVPANYVRGIGEALTSITGLPTYILNMRDDLLAAVHKTSYLLTL